MNRPICILGSLLFAGLLSGCALTGMNEPPASIYDLSAPRSFDGLTRNSRAQVLSAEPKAVKALDTEGIAVKTNAAIISYFGDGQWADRLPKLFQARLVEAFENSGRVRAIGRPGEGLLIHYQIATDIRAFQLETGGSRRAYVEVAAKIIDDRNGKVKATRTFSSEVATGGDSISAAVAGLDRALNQVLRDIVSWTLTKV